jgi:hypothetical protein
VDPKPHSKRTQILFELGLAGKGSLADLASRASNPLIQIDYVCVVDLDIGASKSDVSTIRVIDISERTGRTRACNRELA